MKVDIDESRDGLKIEKRDEQLQSRSVLLFVVAVLWHFDVLVVLIDELIITLSVLILCILLPFVMATRSLLSVIFVDRLRGMCESVQNTNAL